MIAVKSNTAEQGCSPVSSNCVIWQGPSLSCISLCNGDTVSDVMYKVATDLCTLKDQLDLSDLDLECLLTFCAATNPAPTERTLSAVLEFIVDKICCLNNAIDDLNSGDDGYIEPTLALPSCLQYTDQGTGLPVTQLVHRNYTLRIANQYCTLKATVDGHTTQITTLDGRITALENEVPDPLPTVTPECILTPGVPTAMNLVLDELENQYCLLRNILGTNTQLTTAVSQQCENLTQAQALSVPGTMQGIQGWNSTVVNLAQSMQNMWITICDIREAILDLKANIAVTDCTGFVLDFVATANRSTGEVFLDFNPLTVIPLTYGNCLTGSKVTITDGTNTKEFALDLIAEANNSSGTATYIVSGGSVQGVALNTSQTYTVTVEGCVTNGSQTCSKTTIKTITVPCPIVTGVTATIA